MIDSSETPGGCRAHYSTLVGFGHTHVGQEVTFDYEAAQQDGYRFRATQVRPTGGVPDWPTVVVTGPTDAYRSTLTITFDEPDEPDRP